MKKLTFILILAMCSLLFSCETSSDSNDIISVINYYHSQLEASSELTQEEKTSLYIGMVVAGYSAKYWEQCTY